jgi:hypothetical protein
MSRNTDDVAKQKQEDAKREATDTGDLTSDLQDACVHSVPARFALGI